MSFAEYDPGFEPELPRDPEFPEIVNPAEFFALYWKVQQAVTDHVNTAPEEPGGASSIQGRLTGLLRQAGIQAGSNDVLAQLEQLRHRLDVRTRAPQPLWDIPDKTFFAEGITDVLDLQRTMKDYPRLPADSQLSLLDVIARGHADWATYVGDRDRDSLAESLRQTATLMADPIAYLSKFGGLRGQEPLGNTPDPITIAFPSGLITNGDDRVLAAMCLNRGGYRNTVVAMASYVPVAIETAA